MLLRLEPERTELLRFRLDKGKRWRLVVEVRASEDVEVALWNGLHAMRMETVLAEKRERKVSPFYVTRLEPAASEYAFAKGRNFTMQTPDSALGGYWVIAVENLSGFRTDVHLVAYAEEYEAP